MAISSESAASAPTEAVNPQDGTSSKRHEEHQYLDLVREILEDGEHRPDRYHFLNVLPISSPFFLHN